MGSKAAFPSVPGRAALLAACVASCLAVLLLLSSCAGLQFRYASDAKVKELLSREPAKYPQARFLVASDVHLYDASLGTGGSAFATKMDNDRKMLVESDEILQAAMARCAELKPRFLVVSGDLTKDGERVCAELFARRMAEVRAAGVKVYVVPGNHDILNPQAYRYVGDRTETVPNMSPGDFETVFKDCGYAEAFSRDPASLSYAAEPVPGLWLLAVDSCDWTENPSRKEEKVAGALEQKQLDWIEGILAEAASSGRAVIAFQHHGVVEHFPGEAKDFGEYLVRDHDAVARMLAAYNVRVVFTGHYHAQDIALRRWEDGRFLYDVETGSLATPPCAVRLVDIDASQTMAVRSLTLPTIPSFSRAGRDFIAFGHEFIAENVSRIAVKTMKGLGIGGEEAGVLAPQIGDAYNAHYRGDEKFTGKEMIRTQGLSFMGGIVVAMKRGLVEGLWNDPEPADNDIDIDLSTGSWKRAGK